MASYVYPGDGDDDADLAEEAEEQQQPPPLRKKAVHPGALRPVRLRRRAALLPDGARWGGRRRREFLLWRERWKDERRLAREKAWWSTVRAPQDLVVPAYVEIDLANNEIVLHATPS